MTVAGHHCRRPPTDIRRRWQGVREDDIQLLTFTRKTAAELVQRAPEQLGASVALRAGTIDAFCLCMVNDARARASLKPLKVMDQGKVQHALWSRCPAGWDADGVLARLFWKARHARSGPREGQPQGGCASCPDWFCFAKPVAQNPAVSRPGRSFWAPGC